MYRLLRAPDSLALVMQSLVFDVWTRCDFAVRMFGEWNTVCRRCHGHPPMSAGTDQVKMKSRVLRGSSIADEPTYPRSPGRGDKPSQTSVYWSVDVPTTHIQDYDGEQAVANHWKLLICRTFITFCFPDILVRLRYIEWMKSGDSELQKMGAVSP
ncbi:hypothetical protein F5I97DRAFT_1287151 [Phlebopus sp. FC_14]|nr:hypothetical protein F5I97DRAFT_1287151 [Phlebopus sp. FC_14]